MRVIIWARTQVAVPLAVALNCPALIGGMDKADTDMMIERFKADPNAIMIATAAFQTGWRAGVEAVSIFTADSFVNEHQAFNRVTEPRMDCPSVEGFMSWYSERNMKRAKPANEIVLDNPIAPKTYRYVGAPRDREQLRKEINERHHATLASLEDTRADCPPYRREGDEYYCRKCGLRWSVDEDWPLCGKKEL